MDTLSHVRHVRITRPPEHLIIQSSPLDKKLSVVVVVVVVAEQPSWVLLLLSPHEMTMTMMVVVVVDEGELLPVVESVVVVREVESYQHHLEVEAEEVEEEVVIHQNGPKVEYSSLLIILFYNVRMCYSHL